MLERAKPKITPIPPVNQAVRYYYEYLINNKTHCDEAWTAQTTDFQQKHFKWKRGGCF